MRDSAGDMNTPAIPLTEQREKQITFQFEHQSNLLKSSAIIDFFIK